MKKKIVSIFVFCMLLLTSSIVMVAQSNIITEKSGLTNDIKNQNNNGFNWQKTDSGIIKFVEEMDNGYIISGGIINTNWNNDFSDGFVIKLDKQGNKIWETIVDIDRAEYFNWVAKDTNFGYIATGYTYNKNTDDENLVLVKLDDDGNLVWYKIFGGDQDDWGFGVFPDEEGYMVFGNTNSHSLGKTDIWILKVSKTGELISNKTTNRANYQKGNEVKELSDGGYILTGERTAEISGNNYGERRAWLAKLDEQGEIIWDNYYFANYSYALSVVETYNGKYAFVGNFMTDFESDNEQLGFFIKTDTNGNLISQREYLEIKDIMCMDITNDGDFIFFSTDSNNLVTGQDWLLSRVDFDGNIVWNRYFEGLKELGCSNDFAKHCQVTNDGGYIMVGQTGSISVDKISYLIVKTDSTGHLSRAPNNPEIIGTNEGKAGETYDFNFQVVDLDGDDIYYRIDFGDTNYKNDRWVGPFSSGESISVSNEWSSKGEYTIKLTLYDSTLEYSETVTKDITIKKGNPKGIIFESLLERLLQLFPFIKSSIEI